VCWNNHWLIHLTGDCWVPLVLCADTPECCILVHCLLAAYSVWFGLALSSCNWNCYGSLYYRYVLFCFPSTIVNSWYTWNFGSLTTSLTTCPLSDTPELKLMILNFEHKCYEFTFSLPLYFFLSGFIIFVNQNVNTVSG
jgi:hypothetical protein